jgi:hypothetical protein
MTTYTGDCLQHSITHWKVLFVTHHNIQQEHPLAHHQSFWELLLPFTTWIGNSCSHNMTFRSCNSCLYSYITDFGCEYILQNIIAWNGYACLNNITTSQHLANFLFIRHNVGRDFLLSRDVIQWLLLLYNASYTGNCWYLRILIANLVYVSHVWMRIAFQNCFLLGRDTM